MISILSLFLLTTVYADYAIYDLSTTNEVLYVAQFDVCYSLIPLEDPTMTYYVKVNDNGDSLISTIYTNSDCTASTTEYTLPNAFQRLEKLPNNLGGVQECGKKPQALPVYFVHNETCIFVAEDM